MNRNKIFCAFCNKSFTVKANLARHVKTIHENNVNKFKCNLCEYSTSRPDVLKAHKLRHNVDTLKPQSSVFCALCTFKCSRRREMRIHYQTKHDIVLRAVESLEFENEPEFVEWKATVENEECAHFVTKCGRVIAVNRCSNKTYFCFREGNFRGRGKKIRRQKALGTNKINAYCPARIDATFFPSGKISVKFWKTHVGHVTDLRRLKLSKDIRQDIAISLALNIPSDNILDSIRSSSKFERDQLVTRRDLFNIARDFNLKPQVANHGNTETEEENLPYISEESNGSELQDSMIKDLQSGKRTESSNNLEQRREMFKRRWEAFADTIKTEEEMEMAEKMQQSSLATIGAHQSLHQNSLTLLLEG